MSLTLTPEELANLAKSALPLPPREPGVYFLFLGSELVYIGQTMNLLRRLGTHGNRRARSLYDRYAFLPCPPPELIDLERRLIAEHKPRLNGILNGAALFKLGLADASTV